MNLWNITAVLLMRRWNYYMILPILLNRPYWIYLWTLWTVSASDELRNCVKLQSVNLFCLCCIIVSNCIKTIGIKPKFWKFPSYNFSYNDLRFRNILYISTLKVWLFHNKSTIILWQLWPIVYSCLNLKWVKMRMFYWKSLSNQAKL